MLKVRVRNLFSESTWRHVDQADCQAHLSERCHVLSEATSCFYWCWTCHPTQQAQIFSSIVTVQPPRRIISRFQGYGRLGQFVSLSMAVNSAGHSDCSAVNIQPPGIVMWLCAAVCVHLWIHVCVREKAAGCPLLNQPCRVDSAHRALWAVNKRASAKGPRRSQKRGGVKTPARQRKWLPPCLEILNQHTREETEAGVFDRLVPYAENLDVRPVIKCSIKDMKSKESMCCSLGATCA